MLPETIIDVEKIMREIRAKINMESSWEILYDNDYTPSCLRDSAYEIYRINDFISNKRNEVDPLISEGIRIPSFEGRGRIKRKLLSFYARFIRKSTRFITRDQASINHALIASIKALQESNLDLFCALITVLNDKTNAEKTSKDSFSAGVWPSDELYLRFENSFRGTREVIKQRMEPYIAKHVKPRIINLKTDLILDLGSGRGEWLELLTEAGYQVCGVDSNDNMIALCESKGFNVYHEDVFKFLSQQRDCSFQMITSFHLIEHLPFKSLIEFISEIYRVLKPGGTMLLETPNSENIIVGAHNFYLDPDHNRPIHKLLLKFITNEVGFTDIFFDSWENEKNNITDLDCIKDISPELVNSILCSADYALIAKK